MDDKEKMLPDLSAFDKRVEERMERAKAFSAKKNARKISEEETDKVNEDSPLLPPDLIRETKKSFEVDEKLKKLDERLSGKVEPSGEKILRERKEAQAENALSSLPSSDGSSQNSVSFQKTNTPSSRPFTNPQNANTQSRKPFTNLPRFSSERNKEERPPFPVQKEEDINPESRMDEDEGIRPLAKSEQRKLDKEEVQGVESIEKIPRKKKTLKNSPFFDKEKAGQKEITRYAIARGEIIPTGGKASKRLVTEKDADKLDKRKDKLVVTKIARMLLVLFLLALFFIGLKNTFFPEKGLNKYDVADIALKVTGVTGFPIEKGKALVEDYMTRYLNIVPNNRLAETQLKFFYNGQYIKSVSGSDQINDNQSGLKPSKKNEGSSVVTQRVLYPPKVYKMETVSYYVGRYYVSAYVSGSDGSAGSGTNYSEWRETAHWLTFKIDVYWDQEKDTVALIPDTLSLVPPEEIVSINTIPSADSLGTKNEKILPDLVPTIHGFIIAFAESNPYNYESLVQYIPKHPDVALTKGFNKTVVLDGTPDQAISKVAYDTDTPGKYKVDVRVFWRDNLSQSYIGYSGHYIMEMEWTGETYTVTSFKPYSFSADKALGVS